MVLWVYKVYKRCYNFYKHALKFHKCVKIDVINFLRGYNFKKPQKIEKIRFFKKPQKSGPDPKFGNLCTRIFGKLKKGPIFAQNPPIPGGITTHPGIKKWSI